MEQTQVTDNVHNAEQAMDATQESLDRVRDILFGAQIREQDHRRQEFQEQLREEIAAFREESRKRLDALEAFVKRELGSVQELIKTESLQRAEASQNLAQQLKDTAAGMDKRIAGMDEQHSSAERTLRLELVDQSKSLRDELSKLGQSLTALLEKTRTDLQHSKTDRTALAGLLSEMAQRLSA